MLNPVLNEAPVKLSDAKLNLSEETILEHVAASIRRGFPQCQPHPLHPDLALLVCSGPSLKDTEKELRDAYWRGGKIIAVNGAYQWCIDRNLKPSAMVMLDARESNARFVKDAVPGCKYLLASQCHPKVFDICKDRDVYLFHALSGGDAEYEFLKEFYFGRLHPVTIGTTVGTRAISLLRMLGFVDQEIFGFDSCFLDGEHHAFDQPENKDKANIVYLRPEGKDKGKRDDKVQRFTCSAWHIQQAQDFQKLIKERGDLFRLKIHGNGLIAAILRTGAEIQMET